MVIRSELPQDIPGISKLLNQAFGQKSEGILVNELRNTPEFIKDLSIVLEIDHTIIGYLLLYPVNIEHGNGVSRTLALAPMAVSPNLQNQGYGSKLIRHAIAIATEKGWPSVIVLGHPEYYPRFGFEPASKWKVYSDFEVPDEVFMGMELTPGALAQGGKVIYTAPYLNC